MKNNNLLIVISGPSGVGKGAVIKALLANITQIKLAISATTRPIRKGEEDEKDYYFLSNEKFDEAIKNNEFIEWCDVHGNKYGTLKKEIKKINENNKIGIVEIDTNGAQKIKKSYPEIVSIFIAPPTLSILQSRLENRQTETKEEIRQRIENAKKELTEIEHYDYVVINDTIINSSKKIQLIITESFNL